MPLLDFVMDRRALCILHPERVRRPLGTGFVFLRSSWIVTAKHVVERDGLPRHPVILSIVGGYNIVTNPVGPGAQTRIPRGRDGGDENVIEFLAPDSQGGCSGGPVVGSGAGVVGVSIDGFEQNGQPWLRATAIQPILDQLEMRSDQTRIGGSERERWR